MITPFFVSLTQPLRFLIAAVDASFFFFFRYSRHLPLAFRPPDIRTLLMPLFRPPCRCRHCRPRWRRLITPPLLSAYCYHD